MSKPIEHDIPEEVRSWLKMEEAEQQQRYEEIVREMDALDPKREVWVDDFLQRIQTEGFNMDGDRKLKIPAEKVPKKPANPKVRVVY